MAYDINNALERLEENLKNLDSARNQVEKTIGASNKLLGIVKEYVDSLNLIHTNLANWNNDLGNKESDISSQVQNSLSNLMSSCETIEQKFKSATEKTAQEFKSGTENTLKFFKEQNGILTERVTKLKTFQEELQSSMEKIDAIKNMINSIAEELKVSQQGQDEVLSSIDSRLNRLQTALEDYEVNITRQISTSEQNLKNELQDISSILSGISTKLDQIQELTSSTKSTCSNINSFLAEMKNAAEGWHKEEVNAVTINRWILVIGILILIVLHFI